MSRLEKFIEEFSRNISDEGAAKIKAELTTLEAVAEAAAEVAMAAHNIKTAIERFGEAGKFKKMLDDKNEILFKTIDDLVTIRTEK